MSEMTLEEKKARLKDKGVLVTIQRSAVLEFLQGNPEHPTAEEIYQSLRGMYPALSRATIYNTLDLLKQHGLIQEITIERNKAHYDYLIGSKKNLVRFAHNWNIGILELWNNGLWENGKMGELVLDKVRDWQNSS